MRLIKSKNGSMLIELMIGLLMSVFSVLGVMTIYAQFEGQKRTTIQSAQAISNGALAMFPLLQNGKMAGYGINSVAALGCKVIAYNEATSTNFDFRLAPVIINAGATDADTDQITFIIGDSNSYFAPVLLTSTMSSATGDYKVDARYGFKNGDVVVTYEGGKDCSMRQISNVPATPTDTLVHASTTYIDPLTGTSKATKYNKPGGMGIVYSATSSLFNLGPDPSILTYRVSNNQLVQENGLDPTQNTVVGDSIVMLKAVYGFDNDANGDVDNWTNVTPGTWSDLGKVKAVRVALLARSSLREKECNTTTNSNITWLNGQFDISGLPDWGCYRYRVLQTTIPLRNAIWGN